MSDDFFGGILDSMRGVVNNSGSFFDYVTNPDSGVGKAAAYGLAYGVKPQNNSGKLLEAERLSKMNNVADNHNPATPGYAPSRDLDKSNENHSVSFESTEQSWLMRMRRFSQIDSEISAGKINEGKPQ